MDVDDRPQLAQIWLVDGPGADATWPLELGGRYAAKRGEWYFPKGTSVAAILRLSDAHPDPEQSSVGSMPSIAPSIFEPSSAPAETETNGASPIEPLPDPDPAGAPPSMLSPVDAERLVATRQAAERWAGQLVDLTARNNLLYFKHLRAGTLDLSSAPDVALFDLLAGKALELHRLVDGSEAERDATKRARTIHNRAREHFEERGLETMFLACGLATWENPDGSAVPAAPVLMCPTRFRALGAAQGRFELSVTADAEMNEALLHVLSTRFGITVDSDELLALAGIDGAIDTDEELRIVFDWITEKAATVPGFSIRRRFVVGTFAYAKLPMVRDLEDGAETMAGHDLIAALAGDSGAQAAIRARGASGDPPGPNHIPPEDEFLVLDADSSQNYAINRILAGQDLIVHGPPGTGKSQTIVNLIATLTARGRRVLFVAEKRAAIEAVVKRLDDVGLSDLVLDLHGGATSKRDIAQQLATALSTNASIARPELERQHRQLAQRRDELNAHDAALHDRRKPWNLSLFDAQAELIAIGDEPATDVRFRGPALQRLDADTLDQAADDLHGYVGRGGLRIASDPGSPWARARLESPEQARDLQELLDRLAIETLPSAYAALRAAADTTGVSAAESAADWDERLALWQAVAETEGMFRHDVWDEPLDERVIDLAPLAAGPRRSLTASLTDAKFRAALKRTRALVSDGVERARPELLEAVTNAAERRERWNRYATNGSTPGTPENLSRLTEAAARARTGLADLSGRLGGVEITGSEADVTAFVTRLRDDTSTLARLPELHRLKTALQQAGVEPLLDRIAATDATPDRAVAALRHAWLWSIVEHVRLADPQVGSFDGAQHERTVAAYRDADRDHIRTTAQRVRRLVAEQALAAEEEFEDQGTLIRSQAARKRGHLGIRDMFRRSPHLLTALKPCWAMSPLVVSHLLPSDRPYFDVCIFDEASQVRPAEAMPSILRAHSVVVAGDSKQLPPTAFFDSAGDSGGDDVIYDDRVAVDDGYESILEAMQPFVASRMLQWHYRSRDERLIAFSNAHLYDKAMVTFPGVSGPDTISHVLVPREADRPGEDGSTGAEVRQVVDLVLKHAEERPGESLGVIAMGIKHAERIDILLREELRDRPDLEAFFDETRPERFFVKNLERVQGDERDAIILTVGYGKGTDGRMVYRFGPLNNEGGERRLNVAVTRAKSRMTVVSSFASTDLDPERTTAHGADLLRLYLQYAEGRGRRLDRQALETPELNPFEISIRDALEKAGVPVVCQHGASGFRIDFAAKHPTEPGKMVLAIEADGASYHSSESARDRDRLRQEHLERLGWRFHRIWSQDWFNDRDAEIDKATAAYRLAVEAADRLDAPPPPPAPSLPRRPDLRDPRPTTPVAPQEVQAPSRSQRPRFAATGRIDDFTGEHLRAIVTWVQSDTLLRTEDALLAEVMRECGFERRGKKIVTRITEAIRLERSSGIPR